MMVTKGEWAVNTAVAHALNALLLSTDWTHVCRQLQAAALAVLDWHANTPGLRYMSR